jgi:hypothetical protein
MDATHSVSALGREALGEILNSEKMIKIVRSASALIDQVRLRISLTQ